MTDALLIAAVQVAVLILISSAARALHLVFFERYFKLTFTNAPVWSLFYFAAWTLVVVFLFPIKVNALFSGISALGYLVLGVLLLAVFPAVYRWMRTHIGKKWLAELFPGQGMLTLEERYIIAKIADVVFQQCVAGVAILALAIAGASYPSIVGIFFALFVSLHLYIFWTAGFFWGMHYTAYAAFGGFAFPFLILFVPGGIGYAIVLHMLFYVLSAAFFAKIPKPRSKKQKEEPRTIIEQVAPYHPVK